VLDRDGEGGEVVEKHGALVEGRPEVFEEGRGDGEERELLNIGVVRGVVCYH
jgi:hypothetical protein